MKHTLLIRLQGPMQAWGTQSHFVVRDTAREPTKSGVIGLLSAALGRGRDAPLDDIAELRIGVRVDREGKLMVDFHTAQGVLNASGKVLRNAVISNRYYLADAIFLVGLESESLRLLNKLQDALRNPKWLLCLGRRAFPPAAPPWLADGLREGQDLTQALQGFPWLVDAPKSEYQRKLLPEKLRIVVEDERGSLLRLDVPLSFAERTFGESRFQTGFSPKPEIFYEEGGKTCTSAV